MLSRCYNKEYHKNKPTYINCEVCKEWHCFEIFEKWYKDNIYTIDEESIQLDKDIMVKGNKIYSPDTCIFVPQKINLIFCAQKSELPLGVHHHKGTSKFIAEIEIDNKQYHLGSFNTLEEAERAYNMAWKKVVRQRAELYKNRIPNKLYNRLIEISEEV